MVSSPGRRERLARLQRRALRRYLRRQHEALRLEHYFRKKWCKHPPPGWSPHERALHLEDQARLLMVRLATLHAANAPST